MGIPSRATARPKQPKLDQLDQLRWRVPLAPIGRCGAAVGSEKEAKQYELRQAVAGAAILLR